MRMVFCFSMAVIIVYFLHFVVVYYKHGSRRSRRREQMTAKANCFRFGLLGLRAQPVDWLWQRDWQRFFYFLAVGLVVRWGRLHSICDVERNHFFIVLSNKLANFSSFAVKIATKKMKVLLSTTNHIYVIQNTRKKKYTATGSSDFTSFIIHRPSSSSCMHHGHMIQFATPTTTTTNSKHCCLSHTFFLSISLPSAYMSSIYRRSNNRSNLSLRPTTTNNLTIWQ